MDSLNRDSKSPNTPTAETVLDESLTIDEFVKTCVRDALVRDRINDPFFADTAVYRGDAPSDLAENHDHYLYDEPYEM